MNKFQKNKTSRDHTRNLPNTFYNKDAYPDKNFINLANKKTTFTHGSSIIDENNNIKQKLILVSKNNEDPSMTQRGYTTNVFNNPFHQYSDSPKNPFYKSYQCLTNNSTNMYNNFRISCNSWLKKDTDSIEKLAQLDTRRMCNYEFQPNKTSEKSFRYSQNIRTNQNMYKMYYNHQKMDRLADRKNKDLQNKRQKIDRFITEMDTPNFSKTTHCHQLKQRYDVPKYESSKSPDKGFTQQKMYKTDQNFHNKTHSKTKGIADFHNIKGMHTVRTLSSQEEHSPPESFNEDKIPLQPKN